MGLLFRFGLLSAVVIKLLMSSATNKGKRNARRVLKLRSPVPQIDVKSVSVL